MGQMIRRDKTATSTKKRGGARPGSGPKRAVTSDAVKNKILREIDRWEEQTGIGFWRGLVQMAQDEEASNMDKMRAYKTIIDATVVKESHAEIGVTKREEGPAIMLPEQMPDPAEMKKSA